ncbi:Crp/Fnr family transcriptional regulator [Aquimarina sp. 2201CG14-23]|uniref:Crp/Fnr family transcriptional regulator n=1 Tax=Aquimarina mycalae TaxID=3040073 RepID=UPI002478267F|nr:Crp/Fnr family transcriptional regulator [Aquimarina sp. 2201CG14-23]MDH7446222.1 Crp/Fnr family transcriptional regulator [Aquimarina sp. 2201CG14-23]
MQKDIIVSILNTYTKLWFLEDFILFNNLGRITMMKMASVLEMENIDKKEIIELNRGHKKHIFFLKKGVVKIVDTYTGITKDVVNKGSIFGELALFDHDSCVQEQAVALEDCVLCSIEVDRMLGAMNRFPFLKKNMFKAYVARIKKLEQRLGAIASNDSATRINDFILNYISEFGQQQNRRVIAKNLLSHKDIASITNTSRQTVSNIMSGMRKEGTIEYDSEFISISCYKN